MGKKNKKKKISFKDNQVFKEWNLIKEIGSRVHCLPVQSLRTSSVTQK